MWIIAQLQEWDYRYFLWLGSMLFVLFILFAAAVAIYVGRERSQRPES